MKYKVIKEMPFAKVGEIYETDTQSWSIPMITVGKQRPVVDYPLYGLLNNGWIEEVKEESLEEKITAYRKGDIPVDVRDYSKDIAQIAKEHYLEVFDKNIEYNVSDECDGCIDHIRKAIEEA